MKRVERNASIRAFVLVVLVGGIVWLGSDDVSWQTPLQSTLAQTIVDPPVTPQRPSDGGAQVVLDPGESAPDTGDEGDTKEPATPTKETAEPDVTAQPTVAATETRAPPAATRVRSESNRQQNAHDDDNDEDDDAQTIAVVSSRTASGSQVFIYPNGQVIVVLADGRTLLLGNAQDLTRAELDMLPLTEEERQAILHARLRYAVEQTRTANMPF